MALNIVPLQIPNLLNEEAKEIILSHLRDLISDVEHGEVAAVFCAISYGSRGTGGFRAGDQDLSLLGRVEWLKQHMVDGLT